MGARMRFISSASSSSLRKAPAQAVQTLLLMLLSFGLVQVVDLDCCGSLSSGCTVPWVLPESKGELPGSKRPASRCSNADVREQYVFQRLAASNYTDLTCGSGITQAPRPRSWFQQDAALATVPLPAGVFVSDLSVTRRTCHEEGWSIV